MAGFPVIDFTRIKESYGDHLHRQTYPGPFKWDTYGAFFTCYMLNWMDIVGRTKMLEFYQVTLIS